MVRSKTTKLLLVLILNPLLMAGQEARIFPGADEKTPSRSQYFSWINNTNEGTTERQTMINLNFFKWLKDEYGMVLDIYAFDAGAIDGKRFYGSIGSARFKNQFPNGFEPIYKKAKEMNTRLGVWGGPDGFGDTPEEEKARTDQMVGLCKEYEFALFKFDAVCGPLRKEKEDAFINMMEECRKYSPDLILLNHRLGFEKAEEYATTFLWEGWETYIDVFMCNNVPAPHHRAGAISRGLPPNLLRLTEDHGVCISSCLDYWDDDLILQAFNRSLILSPQIYGNPWLLRDDEFPKLARIYNLHRKYRDIMVNGFVLPEATYGPSAVSRGDDHNRIITLRNLSWKEHTYSIRLDETIGLSAKGKVEVRQFHPVEHMHTDLEFGGELVVTVPPFRSVLLLATTQPCDEPGIIGADFQVIKNVKGQPVEIQILGDPGTSKEIRVNDPGQFRKIYLEGKDSPYLSAGRRVEVTFEGEPRHLAPHYKVSGRFEEISPDSVNWIALYESTAFSADNNALEIRSLKRSGPTNIPQVKAAREAFFNQPVFVNRGIWDRNLFDGNFSTGYWPSTRKYNRDQRVGRGCLRLDIGEGMEIDKLILHVPDEYSLQPLLKDEASYVEVSKDLTHWESMKFLAGTEIVIDLEDSWRYFKFPSFPDRIVEIEGYYRGDTLNRAQWRASNLFSQPSREFLCRKVWKTSFSLEEVHKNSYLSVAIYGKHGVEGAYAAATIGGKFVGADDRATSFPSNTWEYVNCRSDKNYTYYIPIDEEDKGKTIEVYVLGFDPEFQKIQPEVWVSEYPIVQSKVNLILEK